MGLTNNLKETLDDYGKVPKANPLILGNQNSNFDIHSSLTSPATTTTQSLPEHWYITLQMQPQCCWAGDLGVKVGGEGSVRCTQVGSDSTSILAESPEPPNGDLLLHNDILQLCCLCIDGSHLVEQLKIGCLCCDVCLHQLCPAAHASCLLHALKLLLSLGLL